MNEFEGRLSPSSVKDIYDDMKTKKTELRHFILDEVRRTKDYMDEISTIGVFECEECGAELTYNEYELGDGSCYKCCGGY